MEVKTKVYKGIEHGDWVDCSMCGNRMLLPCGATVCPECGNEGTLMWVDEEQEKDFNRLSNVDFVCRELQVYEYMDTDTMKRLYPEKFGLLEE